jgi:YbaB/EbfC DNA-binding family
VEASPSANAALRARLDELLGDYDRLRQSLADAQRRIRVLKGTASSSDGSVKAAVDFRGRLTGLEIEPRAYRRFSPSQLAEEIRRLADQAAAQVTGEMAEVMAPFLPAGLSYASLMSGEADTSALSPDAPLTNESYDAWRARFSGSLAFGHGRAPEDHHDR